MHGRSINHRRSSIGRKLAPAPHKRQPNSHGRCTGCARSVHQPSPFDIPRTASRVPTPTPTNRRRGMVDARSMHGRSINHRRSSIRRRPAPAHTQASAASPWSMHGRSIDHCCSSTRRRPEPDHNQALDAVAWSRHGLCRVGPSTIAVRYSAYSKPRPDPTNRRSGMVAAWVMHGRPINHRRSSIGLGPTSEHKQR